MSSRWCGASSLTELYKAAASRRGDSLTELGALQPQSISRPSPGQVLRYWGNRGVYTSSTNSISWALPGRGQVGSLASPCKPPCLSSWHLVFLSSSGLSVFFRRCGLMSLGIFCVSIAVLLYLWSGQDQPASIVSRWNPKVQCASVKRSFPICHYTLHRHPPIQFDPQLWHSWNIWDRLAVKSSVIFDIFTAQIGQRLIICLVEKCTKTCVNWYFTKQFQVLLFFSKFFSASSSILHDIGT